MKPLIFAISIIVSVLSITGEGEAQFKTSKIERFDKPNFPEPKFRQYRLDWCLELSDKCGLPAAQEFCNRQGYNLATDWTIDEHIGATSRTMAIGTRQVCDREREICGGFNSITCALIEKIRPKPKLPPTPATDGEPSPGGAERGFSKDLLYLVIVRTKTGCEITTALLTSNVMDGPFDETAGAQAALQKLKDLGKCRK